MSAAEVWLYVLVKASWDPSHRFLLISPQMVSGVICTIFAVFWCLSMPVSAFIWDEQIASCHVAKLEPQTFTNCRESRSLRRSSHLTGPAWVHVTPLVLDPRHNGAQRLVFLWTSVYLTVRESGLCRQVDSVTHTRAETFESSGKHSWFPVRTSLLSALWSDYNPKSHSLCERKATTDVKSSVSTHLPAPPVWLFSPSEALSCGRILHTHTHTHTPVAVRLKTTPGNLSPNVPSCRGSEEAAALLPSVEHWCVITGAWLSSKNTTDGCCWFCNLAAVWGQNGTAV